MKLFKTGAYVLNFILIQIGATISFQNQTNEEPIVPVNSSYPYIPERISYLKQLPSSALASHSHPLPPFLRGRYQTSDDEINCNPKPSSNQDQYLIGYGSLMQKDSKDRTDPRTGDSIPAHVYGFNRLWNCKGESIGLGTTYLGVKPVRSRRAFFNAVIFKLNSPTSLDEFDLRESYYCREEVPLSRIHVLGQNNKRREAELSRGQYWIYVTKQKYSKLPTKKHPIAQSYVDTFLTGCFELEEKHNLEGFAEDCVATTKEWHSPWVNDRIYPRRPFINVPMAGRIDRLLNEKVPRAFKHIHLE